MRQWDIINPEEIDNMTHIFGCGTIGSFVGLCVAKLGIKNIALYDYDVVEAHNTSNQLYSKKHIGEKKVIALANMLKEIAPTDLNIRVVNGEINRNTEIFTNDKDNVILAFDSIGIRKLVYEKLKERDLNLIDARMGGELFSVFALNTRDDNRREKYEKSLNPIETVDVPCGARSIVYNAFNIAGVVTSVLKKQILEQNYPYEIDMHSGTVDVLKIK